MVITVKTRSKKKLRNRRKKSDNRPTLISRSEKALTLLKRLKLTKTERSEVDKIQQIFRNPMLITEKHFLILIRICKAHNTRIRK